MNLYSFYHTSRENGFSHFPKKNQGQGWTYNMDSHHFISKKSPAIS